MLRVTRSKSKFRVGMIDPTYYLMWALGRFRVNGKENGDYQNEKEWTTKWKRLRKRAWQTKWNMKWKVA